MALLSLKDAAAAVGKDPSTLTRAVKKGELSAETDPRSGHRKFDTSELIRVFGALVPTTLEPTPQLLNSDQMADLHARIEELQARNVELEQLRTREVEDARKERDRWAADAEDWKRMAQQASERLPQLMLEHFKTPGSADASPGISATPPKRNLLRWFTS